MHKKISKELNRRVHLHFAASGTSPPFVSPFPHPLRRSFLHAAMNATSNWSLSSAAPIHGYYLIAEEECSPLAFLPSQAFFAYGFLTLLLRECLSLNPSLLQRSLTFSRMEQFLCYLQITSPFRGQHSLIVHLFIDRETSSTPFFPSDICEVRARQRQC